MAKILVVEDEAPTLAMIKDCLESHGHSVDAVSSGANGLTYLEASPYDLVILDFNLPDLTGVEICQKFRQLGGRIPILFLTGRTDMSDKAAGFNAGADDYLTKPFHPDELALRVTALLRRPVVEYSETFVCANLEIDPANGKVLKDGVEIKLRQREFSVLVFLAKHKGTYFSGQSILTRVWESDSEATEIALRSCVSRLRRQIDSPGQPSIIESVRGLGYRIPNDH